MFTKVLEMKLNVVETFLLNHYILEFGLFYDNFKKPCHSSVNKDFLLLVLDRNAPLELFSTHCPLKERSLIFDAEPLSHSFKIKNLSSLKHVTWLEIWDLNSVLRFDFLILNSVLDLIFWSSIQFLFTFLL